MEVHSSLLSQPQRPARAEQAVPHSGAAWEQSHVPTLPNASSIHPASEVCNKSASRQRPVKEFHLDTQFDQSKSPVTSSSWNADPGPTLSACQSPTEQLHGQSPILATMLFVLKHWWMEWFLVLIAVGIVTIITIVLVLFNQQPLPNWTLSLNLNTLVAILATVLRSSLVLVVEGVLSLAVSAFTQQAIKAVPCTRAVPGVNASLPVAKYANPFRWGNWQFDPSTKARIVGALGSSYSTRPTFLQGCPTGNCTFESFNGTTHATSGFCSRCIETTNLLIKKEEPFPIRSPGEEVNVTSLRLQSNPFLKLIYSHIYGNDRLGLTVNARSETLESLSSSIPGNFTTAINVASITRAACSVGLNCSGFWPPYPLDFPDNYGDWSKFNVVSVSCGLYPCARNIRAESINGKLVETILSETLYKPVVKPLTYSGDTFTAPYAFFPPCWVDNKRYDTQPKDDPPYVTMDLDQHITQLPPCAYGVSHDFSYEVNRFVSYLAKGNCSIWNGRDGDLVDCLLCPDATLEACVANPLYKTDIWWLENLYNSGNASFDSISRVMDNLALAITDSARAVPYMDVTHVPGTVLETTICSEFDWPWLCFPATLVLLTAVSLASITFATTPKSGEPPIWKSSILPLIYGRRARTDGVISSNSLEEMSVSAKEDILVLEKGEEMWEFRLMKKRGVASQ
ncbi:hypothetical protein EJ04DRAFT_601816 [Polyplosphaeria fusca]|uniref:Uncharacterized protein n=1 Tax=Polyplosphaeria fusca TaxID=682080 RepID=A0A9P4V0A0_9PLEO|nr:hypothetical protein EJ04DRAFT_601816 [Polyplosphaeria fusca]